MIEYTTALTDQDLEEILMLQKANRPEQLSDEELKKEGFVSIRHDIDLLRDMNTPYPHVIAKDYDYDSSNNSSTSSRGKVVGYTLSLLRTFDRDRIPLLEGLTNKADASFYNGLSIKDRNYIIMGQVCIHKEYRGKGIFGGLYAKMRTTLSPSFDCVITCVSDRNPRSLRAHAKVGFHCVHRYSSHGENWEVLLWDWTTR